MNHPAPLTLHTGNPTSFLFTSTSLLPEHSVLTDVQQATGRDGQQRITCRSGGEGTRPEIWMGSELVPSSSTANSVTIGLGTQPNGLYHCLSAQSQREYFSLFLKHSRKLCLEYILLIISKPKIFCTIFCVYSLSEYYASGIDRMCTIPHRYT